jgi:hypothetical protein
MIKHFCDVCSEEIGRNYVTDRLRENIAVYGVTVHLELLLGVGFNAFGNGDLCVACMKLALLEVVKSLRPEIRAFTSRPSLEPQPRTR